MTPTTEARLTLASKLESRLSDVPNLRAFVGLDGFVDEIFQVVDKRHDAEHYDPIPTIAAYADRIRGASGQSTNIELARRFTKLGGNGPIMANALAGLGLQVTYLGSLGFPNLHHVFEEFSRRAKVHSIADPGLTDALEFEDGKIMVGKHYTLKDINWENIIGRFGVDRLKAQLSESDLVGFVNWTMLPHMTHIWEQIQAEVLSNWTGPRRRLFFDLADPEKRLAKDIAIALNRIRQFQEHFDVILGLNEKEAYEVARVLGLDGSPRDPEGLIELSLEIHRQVAVDTLVVHPVSYALAVSDGVAEAVAGPVCRRPKITTGAGDHFNSGFCLGKLLNLSNTESLMCGVSTSGHYVRNAASPGIPELASLLRSWPLE